jgi:amino acid transporter
VASMSPGLTGKLLAHAARVAFMSGMQVSLAAGAIVGLAGALIALVYLPSRLEPDGKGL